MLEAVQKHKLRAGLSTSFNKLNALMNQGTSGYSAGTPEHGLSHQMHQGEGGYKAGAPTHKLQKQMGQ